MATTPHRAPHDPSPTLAAPASASALHFAVLTEAEQASFQAGLKTRIWSRLYDAIKAPTSGAYRRTRDQHLRTYMHLVEVLRAERGMASSSITDNQVMKALQAVEQDLGAPWRHKLEHAINSSQAAVRIVARLQDEAPQQSADPTEDVLRVTRWVSGWMLLNWSIECALAATDPQVIAQPEVVSAIFEDLREAASLVYSVACEAHDARFGDPDDLDD